jgi:hypothetical protein
MAARWLRTCSDLAPCMKTRQLATSRKNVVVCRMVRGGVCAHCWITSRWVLPDKHNQIRVFAKLHFWLSA